MLTTLTTARGKELRYGKKLKNAQRYLFIASKYDFDPSLLQYLSKSDNPKQIIAACETLKSLGFDQQLIYSEDLFSALCQAKNLTDFLNACTQLKKIRLDDTSLLASTLKILTQSNEPQRIINGCETLKSLGFDQQLIYSEDVFSALCQAKNPEELLTACAHLKNIALNETTLFKSAIKVLSQSKEPERIINGCEMLKMLGFDQGRVYSEEVLSTLIEAITIETFVATCVYLKCIGFDEIQILSQEMLPLLKYTSTKIWDLQIPGEKEGIEWNPKLRCCIALKKAGFDGKEIVSSLDALGKYYDAGMVTELLIVLSTILPGQNALILTQFNEKIIAHPEDFTAFSVALLTSLKDMIPEDAKGHEMLNLILESERPQSIIFFYKKLLEENFNKELIFSRNVLETLNKVPAKNHAAIACTSLKLSGFQEKDILSTEVLELLGKSKFSWYIAQVCGRLKIYSSPAFENLTNEEIAIIETLVKRNISDQEPNILKLLSKIEKIKTEDYFYKHFAGFNQEELKLLKTILTKENQEDISIKLLGCFEEKQILSKNLLETLLQAAEKTDDIYEPGKITSACETLARGGFNIDRILSKEVLNNLVESKSLYQVTQTCSELKKYGFLEEQLLSKELWIILESAKNAWAISEVCNTLKNFGCDTRKILSTEILKSVIAAITQHSTISNELHKILDECNTSTKLIFELNKNDKIPLILKKFIIEEKLSNLNEKATYLSPEYLLRQIAHSNQISIDNFFDILKNANLYSSSIGGNFITDTSNHSNPTVPFIRAIYTHFSPDKSSNSTAFLNGINNPEIALEKLKEQLPAGNFDKNPAYQTMLLIDKTKLESWSKDTKITTPKNN